MGEIGCRGSSFIIDGDKSAEENRRHASLESNSFEFEAEEVKSGQSSEFSVYLSYTLGLWLQISAHSVNACCSIFGEMMRSCCDNTPKMTERCIVVIVMWEKIGLKRIFSYVFFFHP